MLSASPDRPLHTASENLNHIRSIQWIGMNPIGCCPIPRPLNSSSLAVWPRITELQEVSFISSPPFPGLDSKNDAWHRACEAMRHRSGKGSRDGRWGRGCHEGYGRNPSESCPCAAPAGECSWDIGERSAGHHHLQSTANPSDGSGGGDIQPPRQQSPEHDAWSSGSRSGTVRRSRLTHHPEWIVPFLRLDALARLEMVCRAWATAGNRLSGLTILQPALTRADKEIR